MYEDKLCAVCDRTISAWGEPPPASLFQKGYCSWCFQECEHKLIQKNIVKRSVYQCQSCSRRSIPCRRCKIAFSRGLDDYDDELCYHCDGTVEDWNSVDYSKLRLRGWCSWCFEPSNHKLEQRNVVRRNVYICESCTLRTLPCTKCSEGMTRGGVAWDDSWCASCSGETKEGWTVLKQRKDEVIAMQRDKDKVIAELKRESVFIEKAKKNGVLRPFLLLVAMAPIFRNQVSSFLGWSIFTKKFFGDPHAEAWEIIHGSYTGMQARANKAYQKLNAKVLNRNCNWKDILVRTAKCTFQRDFTKLVSCKEDLELISDLEKENAIYNELEEEFLVELGLMMKSQMSQKQFEELEISMKSEEAENLKYLISTNAQITKLEAMQYAFSITQQMARFSTRTILMRAVLPSILQAVGVTILQAGLLATPMLIVGFVALAANGIRIAFGSSEGRLFVPVVLILNQKFLLAVEGLRLEDYM